MSLSQYDVYTIEELRDAIGTARFIVKHIYLNPETFKNRQENFPKVDTVPDRLEYIFKFLTMIAGLSKPIKEMVTECKKVKT